MMTISSPEAKTCSYCLVEKPIAAFYTAYGKPEARCSDCKNAWMKKHRDKLREAEILANETPDTVCPCDHCFKQTDCQVECASFKCWSEHGV